MSATTTLLQSPDLLRHLRREGIPTGLADLDRVTHGLLPGTLWVVGAAPGAGRSMLSAQIARVASVAGGVKTKFISGREDREQIASYWLASESRVTLNHLAQGRIDTSEVEKLEAARQRLSAAPLEIWTESDGRWDDEGWQSIPSFRSLVGGSHRSRVVVADDVDVLLQATLGADIGTLRSWTRQQPRTLVVTVPEEQIMDGSELAAGIARDADVVILLRQCRSDGPRLGEADLHVLRNRYGPRSVITVHFQGFRAAFVTPP